MPEDCLTPWDVQSRRVHPEGGTWPTLYNNAEGGGGGYVMQKVYMLKTRGGAKTYMKDDGKVGTAGKGGLVGEDVSFTIGVTQDQTMFQPVGDEYVVRRLMPVETERLQALPDGWTDLTGCDVDEVTEKVAAALGYEKGTKDYGALRRKVVKWSRECPDSPRYKATGNSITTLPLEIIGKRIEAYDTLHYDEVGLQ